MSALAIRIFGLDAWFVVPVAVAIGFGYVIGVDKERDRVEARWQQEKVKAEREKFKAEQARLGLTPINVDSVALKDADNPGQPRTGRRADVGLDIPPRPDAKG